MKTLGPVRLAALSFLGLLYLLTWLAPFVAPYSHKRQFREWFLSPPSELRLVDTAGRVHLRPFVQVRSREGIPPVYRETDQTNPVRFLVRGEVYTFLGMEWETHLFGFDPSLPPVFLLGSDGLGRDLLSRILYGARFSLTIGLTGILFTLLFGVAAGAAAGYFAGWTDRLCMRLVDLFLSLPGLFVILGIRAVFPRELSSWRLYWLVVLIFTLLGWASVARVIRGQVLSLVKREWVLAARVSGVSHARILWRHILPFTSNYLLVQSLVLIPAFILAEVTLSFLGVGVQEPDASWGNLLISATSVRTFTSHPWLLTPGVFIVLTVFAFNLLGAETDAGRERLQRWG